MAQPPMKIYFNGKEYNSLEEVPEEFRHFLKDENKDGLPDFVENIFGKNLAGVMNNPLVQKFVFKNKVFDQLSQLPAEEQRKVREKLESLNQFIATKQNPGQGQASLGQPFSNPASQGLDWNSQNLLGGAHSPVKSSSNTVMILLMVVAGFFILSLAFALLLLFR